MYMMRLLPHGMMTWNDAYGNNPISTLIGEFLLLCVCRCEGNTYVCASEHKFGVATNHGKLGCDWAPMSNGFYLS